MAAKKKSKSKKSLPKKSKSNTKKPVAKKSVAKKSKPAAKKSPAKKAAKAPVKTKAKKSAPKRKKQALIGEGDYAATRKFDKDQAGFVKRNKANIAKLGKAAEDALDGPEGDSLRDAEAKGLARSADKF